MGLVVEEFLSEGVADGGELTEASGLFADCAFGVIQGVWSPFGQREAVRELMGEAAERDGGFSGTVRIAFEELAIVLVAEGVVRKKDVADVTGAALAALDRAAAENRAAAEAGADDDDKERFELFIGERAGGDAAPGERAAADRIFTERGGLTIANVADGDTGLVFAEGGL